MPNTRNVRGTPRHLRLGRLIGSCLVTGAVAAVVASSDAVPATWRQQPVKIDGNSDEWTQGLVRLSDAPASVGVMNDGENLYVAIAISDQAQRRRLLAAGLNVWFDKDGGKKKHFGIRIPGEGFRRGNWGSPPTDSSGSGSSGSPTGPPLFPQEDADGSQEAQTPPAQTPPPTQGQGQSQSQEQEGIVQPQASSSQGLASLTHFDVLGPDEKDHRRVERDANSGIDVERNLVEGMLIYEIKVPLAVAGSAAYGIGTAPGQKIGIGLETPKMERPSGGGRPGGGMGRGGGGGWGGGGMGGGMGRGGMGRGGMGGGGIGGGRRGGGYGGQQDGENMKPLNAWMSVQLAKAV